MELNVCGKACPLPVIETKNALKENKELTVILDDEIACENVEKMLSQLGYEFKRESKDNLIYLQINGGSKSIDQNIEINCNTSMDNGYNVVIDSKVMGKNDAELGAILMKNFIYALSEQIEIPKKIVFYNEGVKLVCEEGDILNDLKKLQEQGCEIYACGVCLNFYGLTDEIKIGEITNMYHIVEMLKETKVVKC